MSVAIDQGAPGTKKTVSFSGIPPRAPRLPLLFFAATVAYVAAFAAMLVQHLWLWDSSGKLVALDFVNVYAAGQLALAGHPAGIYDWPIHRAAESAALGYPLSWADYYGWHYPPPFLFLAAGLATLPYLAAFFAWGLGTLPLYLMAVRAAADRAQAWIAAAAFPATFFNIAVGQNGFVTAALAGGALVMLETSPILSGFLIGLLTYKPQFGILFPFALLAGGHGRTFLAAAMTALGIAALSWLAFGDQTWIAFFHSVTVTVDAVLVRGMAGWAKLNSFYGLARWLGLGAGSAALLQGSLIAALAVAVVLQWRCAAPQSLKAAGLIVASLLATPYLYVYDLPVLAVALAFMVRAAPFQRLEYAIAALAIAAICAFPLVASPTGLAGVILVAALVVRRTLPCFAQSLPAPVPALP